MSFDVERKSSCVSHYLYVGEHELMHVAAPLILLCQILNQDSFTALRTEQKLGYLVDAGFFSYNGRCGVAINLVGEKSAGYLDKCITEYLRGFGNILHEMKEEKLDEYKDALVAGFSENFETMDEEYVDMLFILTLNHFI